MLKVSTLFNFSEKRSYMLIYHFSRHHSHSQLIKYENKARTPMIMCKNYFTNILNSLFADSLLKNEVHCEVKKFLHDYATGRNSAIKTIMNILQIEKDDARKIVSTHWEFEEIPKKKIVTNYELLKENGFPECVIQEYIQILSQPPCELQDKIQLLSDHLPDLGKSLQIQFLLFKYSSLEDLFTKFQANECTNLCSRVKKIAQELKLEENQIYLLMINYFPSMILHFDDTIQKIKLMLEAGIKVEEFFTKKWPLSYPYEYMEYRLENVPKNIIKIQTWVFQYTEKQYKREAEKRVENATMLKYLCAEKSKVIDYLMKETQFNKKYVEYCIDKLPLDSMNFQHCLKITDILKANGYDCFDIVHVPRILLASADYINQRFSVLNKYNHKPFLYVLLEPDDKFNLYICGLQ